VLDSMIAVDVWKIVVACEEVLNVGGVVFEVRVGSVPLELSEVFLKLLLEASPIVIVQLRVVVINLEDFQLFVRPVRLQVRNVLIRMIHLWVVVSIVLLAWRHYSFVRLK